MMMAVVSGHPGPSMAPKNPPAPTNLASEIASASKESLFATAAMIVEDKASCSEFLGRDDLDRIPRFESDELRIGKVLGRGGFCVVTDIDKVKIPEIKQAGSSVGSNSFHSFFKRSNTIEDPASNPSSDAGSVLGGSERITPMSGKSLRGADLSSRRGVASLARKKNRKGGYFALKKLSSDVYSNKLQYLKGLVDLAIEAKFLASLDHPNIISLCGVSQKGPSHFIMLERLSDTLSKKFTAWIKIDRQCKGITGMVTGSKRKEADLYEARIGCSLDIASAMKYLHDNNIIYRDLKPDNIGFDAEDCVKLFDFGLAKELLKKDRDEDGLYKLTSTTGSFRYMAPEVSLGMPYNLSADVYSWSIIMWFILALEPPFGFYTEDMIRDRVHKRGSRPAIFSNWSEPLGDIMKRSWNAKISERPAFSEICAILKMELRSDLSCTSVASSTTG